MNQPRLLDYLDHIEAALDLADKIVSECDEEDFMEGRCPLHDAAAVRQVELIGEIATQIRIRYRSLIDAHPEVPWKTIWDTRNRWIHGYFNVDLSIVWHTIARDLPSLRKVLAPLRATAQKIEPRCDEEG